MQDYNDTNVLWGTWMGTLRRLISFRFTSSSQGVGYGSYLVAKEALLSTTKRWSLMYFNQEAQ